MNTVIAAPPLRRVSYSFAADGSHAACLATPGDGRWHVESWTLSNSRAVPGGSARHRTDEQDGPAPVLLAADRSEHLHTQLLSLSDGSVLLCRHHPGRHEIVHLGGPGGEERVLAEVRMPGLRLLPYPGPDALALALATDTTPVTSVSRILPDGELALIAELSGMYGGGVWLDPYGDRLALDAVAQGMVKTAVLDLRDGVLSPFLELSARSNDRLTLCDPAGGLMVVSSDAPGSDRIGWIRLPGGGEGPETTEQVRFPELVNLADTVVRPLAVAPDGRRVALQLDKGAGSQLAVCTPEEGTLQRLRLPGGCLGGAGRWTGTGLHLPFSAPDRPSGLATVVPEAEQQWRLAGSAAPHQSGGWRTAHLELLVGEVGPVEAIVYGGPDWRTAEHVVVALHGGPASAWRFEFDPLLQRLAQAGVAVVAPNQRGSTGYGAAYKDVLHGRWGVPDLADVCALSRMLAAERATAGLAMPSLFGVSYGAYLALLTAAVQPAPWSAVVAVAPFLSGPRLIAEASVPIRSLMTRLGGDTAFDGDATGVRDVLALCDRIAAPLLFVHGDRDDTIPVGQSRSLRHKLLQLGRTEGDTFTYLELPGTGHDVLAGEGAPELTARLTAFLRDPSTVRT